MATVRDLIEGALRKIGVIASGEPMKAHEANDGLEALRMLVDTWALEPLMIPTISTITKQLVVGEVIYTIGDYPTPVPDPLPGNHIQSAQPREILAAWIRDSSGTDYKMDTMNTWMYSDISIKNVGARPSRFYVEDGWPLQKLYLESEPYADDVLYLKARINLNDALPLASLDDDLNLPYGYESALMYNLAIDIASEYGMDVPQVVALRASNTLRSIKNANSQALVSRVDRALSQQIGVINGYYDINQGP